MPRRFARSLWQLGLGAAIHLVAVTTAAADTMSASERSGQRLYQLGQTDDGELTAQLAQGAVRVAGAPAACARCHGSDGDGSSEAGLTTPALGWSQLTRARSAGAGLRERPAYDETTLHRALRQGLDAAGQPLNPAMPRFELTQAQESALFAYLRSLGSERDLAPGVSHDAVRIAFPGDRSPAAQAAHQSAQACLNEANRRGGVFGRRLEAVPFDTAELAEAGASAALAASTALVLAPWWPDTRALGSFATIMQHERMIVLGPWPPAGVEATSLFHVVPDHRDSLRVIVDHLARQLVPGPATIAVVAPPELTGRDDDLAVLRDQVALHGHLRLSVARSADRPELTRLLAQHGPAAVIDLGDAAHLARTEAAMAAAGLPDTTPVYALFVRTGRPVFALPARARARLALAHAYPIGGEAAPQRMLQLLRDQGVALQQPAAQAAAYAAGCIAVEALMRTGRRITRDRLQRALESIARFETGVTTPLTFGPRQRRGVWGARIVKVEGDGLVATSPWLTPMSP